MLYQHFHLYIHDFGIEEFVTNPQSQVTSLHKLELKDSMIAYLNNDKWLYAKKDH